ncbi:MAG: zinc-ribbon domain-containing protein [bacterium]
MNFCSNCGAEVEIDDSYCGNCGEELSASIDGSNPTGESSPTGDSQL